MADSNREAEKSQLRSLLQEALAPETAKTASDAIRQLLQQPQGPQKRTVFLLLAEEALQGEKDELRQLAAVLLRRKISTAFGCMNPSEQVCRTFSCTESLLGFCGSEVLVASSNPQIEAAAVYMSVLYRRRLPSHSSDDWGPSVAILFVGRCRIYWRPCFDFQSLELIKPSMFCSCWPHQSCIPSNRRRSLGS